MKAASSGDEIVTIERDADCEDVAALLGTLESAREGGAGADSSEFRTDSWVSNATRTLKAIFTLVSSDSQAERQFFSCTSFGRLGDLVHNLLKKLFAVVETSATDVQTGNVRTTAFVRFCVNFFVGFSLVDEKWLCPGDSKKHGENVPSRRDFGPLRYPQAFAVAIQLLSLWDAKLDAECTRQLMKTFVDIANIPGNAHRLASDQALEVMLRAFTAKPYDSGTLYEASVDNQKLSRALFWETNTFHELAVSLVEVVALAGVSVAAANYWVKMLLCICRERSRHVVEARNALTLFQLDSPSRGTTHPSPPAQATNLSTEAPFSPVPSLLRLLVKLTSATFEHTMGAPVIRFDMSKEGFGCLQIPDINDRAASLTEPAAPASSLPTFSHHAKVWPPPDGYSVMVWFRVDSFELKSERDKLYRECFMANTCIHCGRKIQDEYVLKCSHRACRGCAEALRNSNGECVVCNPPIFYLFRFRSVDSKSVSEAFLKGGKIYMRTNTNRASTFQFSHAPIKTRQWYSAVFTHAKQRFQSSMVSFYLNGILQETVKICYPSSITGNRPLNGLLGVPSQARRYSSAKWMLGPFYLLDLPISAPVVNAVFAAGPSYDRLFSGATGNSEVGVTFDHLAMPNMVLLDEYMWNPVRSLIDSVDADHEGHNELLRRSLSIASAASSTAAAIVQDIKSNANIFARVPSSVPLIHIPVTSERIVMAYTSQNGHQEELSIPSSKLDGRPTGHLMGGTTLSPTATMANAMFEICSSGCQIAYSLLGKASTGEEVELTLDLLCNLMCNNPRNLSAMEQEHGYGLVNCLLHQKASLMNDKCLQIIFRIVGIDIEHGEPEHQYNSSGVLTQPYRESAIRNLQALQYFILDYSLWQKVPGTDTAKLLFSTLYSCLAADNDVIRERNRAQLQSLSFVRQLLYVLIDPNVSSDLQRVIVDVILVCLTSSSRESSVEANFADVTGFLAATLSPRFGQYRGTTEEESTLGEAMHVSESMKNDDGGGGIFKVDTSIQAQTLASVTARLCLSPRGYQRKSGESWGIKVLKRTTNLNNRLSGSSGARLNVHQAKIQDLLLGMLLKAVQKYDVKETKEHGGYQDGLLVPEVGVRRTSTLIGSVRRTSGGSTTAPRVQLPTNSRMTGFRKCLGPHWIEYFLFPGSGTEFSIVIAPSTVVVALRLLCALLCNSRYENVFKKEGYYRLLAQGLPCRHSVFSSINGEAQNGHACFPFQEMWYALLGALLGAPIDGHPHEIRFEIEYLCKDFEVNIERDRVVNPSILIVVMTLLRRHYNDTVAMVSLTTDDSTENLSTLPVETPTDEKELNGIHLSARLLDLEESGLYHLEVLDFIQHIFERMPTLHTMFVDGSEAMRLEFLEELTRLICAAARTHLMSTYPSSRKHIIQVLWSKQVPLTEYNIAVCGAELAEEVAAADINGSDPFLHHPVAARALRLLIALLMKFLLDSPNGHDLVEEYIDGTANASILLPPLHSGLILRFQSLVVLGLLDHVRAKFNDGEVLMNHKPFEKNVRDFVRFTVKKMHCWQRAQHGDGCPPPFACCGRAHFFEGPSHLLELVLFVLAEANSGISDTNSGGPSSVVVPSPSSLSGLLSDKLTKGKKRQAFRQLISRMSVSRPTELESLLPDMHAALRAVVLHVFHGRGAEVGDDELEAMLQQIHEYRGIVFGSHNKDKTFSACLCRYLLQLLADTSVPSLQEAAAYLWIDLMQFQPEFMGNLLTIEIRKSGTPSYSVNLMKNGFDVLLECCTALSSSENTCIIKLPSFVKFSKWLEVVGLPLKELETTLDRIYIKAVMETKEIVREAWSVYQKETGHRNKKCEKQFGTRYDWIILMEQKYVESLLRAEQNEFRRQLKWRQDRIDRQEFNVRQWQKFQREFSRNFVDSERKGSGEQEIDESAKVTTNSGLMLRIAKQSRYEPTQTSHESCCWRLDFTEGPYRMRKRLSRMVQSPNSPRDLRGQHSHLHQPEESTHSDSSHARYEFSMGWNSVHRPLRRRYSEADIVFSAEVMQESSASVGPKQRTIRQKSDDTMTIGIQHLTNKRVFASSASGSAVLSSREQLHRGSFEALLNKYVKTQHASWRDSLRFSRLSARPESICDYDGSSDDVAEKEEEDPDENDGVDSAVLSESAGAMMLEEIVDEKLRPLLIPGDDIVDIFDCLRIDGMDSCPGVFLVCNDHAYIIDNYMRLDQQASPQSDSENYYSEQNSQIRVVEVPQGSMTLLERRQSWRLQQESPRHVGLLKTDAPSLAASSVTKDVHQCRFWEYEDITELHKRRYQLRHVALEIFANDGRNYLITFESPKYRELVFHALLSKCPNVRGAASGLDRVTAGDDLYSQLRKLLRNSMTERWVHGDISNFAYLMHLNTLAGRSYNDLTQYPVFPWILADYESEELDLSDPSVYRDLSKPMGALRREEEFRARYEGLVESAASADDSDHPLSSRPFHYGTHYSSAATTLHYLMRLEPFTSHFRRLHGGKFDHADRLFTSVNSAWKSAAGFEGGQNGTQDVKELIPEFFYLPEFLENVNDRTFGRSQNGVAVGDVELPPWANRSATEFVRLNRAALESPYVSAHLHQWIDLIFGFKQQGPAAVEACNVFYHLTYEGSVDLDAITDVSTKRAMLDQITEFGQTPSQLFRTPHPARVASVFAENISTNGSLLVNSVGPFSASHNGEGGSTVLTDNAESAGSHGRDDNTIVESPMTTRRALANSFLEGGELIARMQTILSNGTGLGGTFIGEEDVVSPPILENAALLQQELQRQVQANTLLASYNRDCQTTNVGLSVHGIAWTSGGVGRAERVVTVGPKCLLIPPRNNEYIAWGFRDRSVKVISAGPAESGGHGSDSKVVACLELDVDIDVAAITADGHIVVTSSPDLPVLRVWRLNATQRTLAASIAAASGSSSAAATSSSAAAVASSLAAASSLSTSHRRRTYATTGSSTRSLTLVGTIGSPLHHHRITALQASRAYSVLVSGCAGGVAVLWDLNRRRFIRRLPSVSDDSCQDTVSRGISAICINEVTGDIIVASGTTFGVYDINGGLRVRLDDRVVVFSDPAAFSRSPITLLAVNRGEECEWNAEKHLVTGHADGTLCVWTYSQAGGQGQEELASSRSRDNWSLDLQGLHRVASRSAVTAACVSPDKTKLYTGTQDGQLVLWTS